MKSIDQKQENKLNSFVNKINVKIYRATILVNRKEIHFMHLPMQGFSITADEFFKLLVYYNKEKNLLETEDHRYFLPEKDKESFWESFELIKNKI